MGERERDVWMCLCMIVFELIQNEFGRGQLIP